MSLSSHHNEGGNYEFLASTIEKCTKFMVSYPIDLGKRRRSGLVISDCTCLPKLLSPQGLWTRNEPGTIRRRGQPSAGEGYTCRRTACCGTCHGFEDEEGAVPADIELYCQYLDINLNECQKQNLSLRSLPWCIILGGSACSTDRAGTWLPPTIIR
jgi:hypothetical protein